MKNEKGVITVLSQYIDRGIKKYEGVEDPHLNKLIKNAGLDFTAYRFNDNRILLVLPQKSCAFLYKNDKAVYANLDLA